MIAHRHDTHDHCDCGAELRGGYERFTGECARCEHIREMETEAMILCDPRMSGRREP